MYVAVKSSTPTGVVVAEPSPMDFGETFSGDAPLQQNLVITNYLDTNTTITGYTFSNNDTFRLVAATGSINMSPDDSIILRLGFYATDIGSYSETLTISFNNYDDIVVPLMGIVSEKPDPSWLFYFTEEVVHLDCVPGSDYCEGVVPFEVASTDGCLGYINPVQFAESVAGEIELSFNPCNLIYYPDLIGDPSYGMVYEEKNGGCTAELSSACEIVAQFDRESISLVSQDCHLRGSIAFTITGEENVAQCTNLTVERERQSVDELTGEPLWESDGVTPIMEFYDYIANENFFLSTNVTAAFPADGGISGKDNITIAVTKLTDDIVEDQTELSYYSAYIKAVGIDNSVPALDFALRFKNSKGSSLPFLQM